MGVDAAEVAVLVEAYLIRNDYGNAARAFRSDASRQLVRVAPITGRVKDLEHIVNAYVRAHHLIQPIHTMVAAADRRRGPVILGLAATLFSLRVMQLRLRRRRRMLEAGEATAGPLATGDREEAVAATKEPPVSREEAGAATKELPVSREEVGAAAKELPVSPAAPPQVEAEPSWLGEAAALVGLTYEATDDDRVGLTAGADGADDGGEAEAACVGDGTTEPAP